MKEKTARTWTPRLCLKVLDVLLPDIRDHPVFALFCGLTFAFFCTHLRFFARVCVFLRPAALRTTAFGNCRNLWAGFCPLLGVVPANQTEESEVRELSRKESGTGSRTPSLREFVCYKHKMFCSGQGPVDPGATSRVTGQKRFMCYPPIPGM